MGCLAYCNMRNMQLCISYNIHMNVHKIYGYCNILQYMQICISYNIHINVQKNCRYCNMDTNIASNWIYRLQSKPPQTLTACCFFSPPMCCQCSECSIFAIM